MARLKSLCFAKECAIGSPSTSLNFVQRFSAGMVLLDSSYAHTTNITKTCLLKYTENFTTRKWKFSDKTYDIFHISAQNIDCGYSLESHRHSLEPPRRGGSNEYPQSMFLSRNMKNNVYPCKAQFYSIKVGFKRVNIIQACFRDEGHYFVLSPVSRQWHLR